MTTHENMGNFIAQARKARGLTQRELADRLGVTDKAVSKWERGLSCPDVTLLAPLAALLGVTADELLAGERCGGEEIPELEPLPCAPPPRTAGQTFRQIFGSILTCLMFIAIAVCVICDRAITGTLTWSPYPVSSIVFAFLVLLPVLCRGRRGVVGMLVVLSVTIVPYLWVLNHLLGGKPLLLPIGILSAVIGLGYLWVVFALFKRLERKKLLAGAIALLLAVPVRLGISLGLNRLFHLPTSGLGGVWDILLLCAGGALLFAAFTHARDEE